jgi:hypothetical protein
MIQGKREAIITGRFPLSHLYFVVAMVLGRMIDFVVTNAILFPRIQEIEPACRGLRFGLSLCFAELETYNMAANRVAARELREERLYHLTVPQRIKALRGFPGFRIPTKSPASLVVYPQQS